MLKLCWSVPSSRSHDKALASAQSAIRLLVQEFDTASNTDPKTLLFDIDVLAERQQSLSPDRLTVLGIAYHNLAVEQEFLR
jgi:hypothetical protein